MCPKSGKITHGLWREIRNSNDPSRLEQAFAALDMNGDGMIGSSDLFSFFRFCLGQSIPQEDAEAMIALADVDGNGTVDFLEFQRFMTEVIATSSATMDGPERKAMNDIFRVLDGNNDGLLCAEDLKVAMDLAGQQVSDEELDAMIAAAVGSRTAPIDFDCFASLMANLHV